VQGRHAGTSQEGQASKSSSPGASAARGPAWCRRRRPADPGYAYGASRADRQRPARAGAVGVGQLNRAHGPLPLHGQIIRPLTANCGGLFNYSG
jgi:hypothetical protein